MLTEGLRIKTYPDTDIDAYVRWIRDEGFRVSVYRDAIVVGQKYKSRQVDVRAYSKELRKRRIAAGFTEITFANALGVSQQSVRDWEAGRRMPSYFNRQIIEEVFRREKV